MSDVPLARQALKQLLLHPMVFTPVEAGNGRCTYAFQGELNFGGSVIREVIISAKNPRADLRVFLRHGLNCWCPLPGSGRPKVS
jgi:hypothetical protein